MEEPIKPSRTSGGVVIGPGNRVVVVSNRYGAWSLPKGVIGENEDSESTAVREIFEETGIQDVNIIENLGSYERSFEVKNTDGTVTVHSKSLTFFLCITNQNDLKPIDEYNPEAEWLEVGEVADRLTIPEDKAFFHSITPRILQFMHEGV